MALRLPFFEFDPFEDMLSHAFRADPDYHNQAVTAKTDGTMFPRYRAVQDQNAMVLEVELPGVDRSTIALDVNRKHISLTAKRPIWTASNGENSTKRVEVVEVNESSTTTVHNDAKKGASTEQAVTEVRSDGHSITYSAKFRLGYDVEVEQVSAEMKEGILRIRVPRHEDMKAVRRVEVAMRE